MSEVKRSASDDEPERPQPKRVRKSHQDFRRTQCCVYVGPDDVLFKSYVELLMHNSAFFNSDLKMFATDDESREPTSMIFAELPKERPSDFARFHLWLDTKKLCEAHEDIEELLPFDLASLYCFSERIGSRGLAHAVIDALHMRTRHLVDRITTSNRRNIKQHPNNYFSAYYRVVRWANAAEVRSDSRLYEYLVHFFAFFVLQTVPKLEQRVLQDLPASFLWQVLRAVSHVMQRYVPEAPAELRYWDDEDAKNKSHQDDVDADGEGFVESATGISDSGIPSYSRHLDGDAVEQIPKHDLIQAVLLESAFLRMARRGFTQPPPSRKRGRPFKNAQKANGNDGIEVEAVFPSASETGQQNKERNFFGPDTICDYHAFHFPHLKEACAHRSRQRFGENVWADVPVMKS